MTVRTRTFLSIFAASSLALAVSTLLIERTLRQHLYDDIERGLLTQARLAAALLADLGSLPNPDAEADRLGQLAHARVTLIAADGRVLGDSEVSAANLHTVENHATREEIVEAARSGEGTAARQSQTTTVWTMYTAASVARGPVAFVHTGKIVWFEKMDKRHTTKSEFSVKDRKSLPRVDIIYAHSNMSVDLIQAAIDKGAQGLVIAGVGDGNMSQAALDALGQAVKRGIVVVRSTRVESGIVLRNNEVDDDKLGFVASAELNPPKSRVLLQLALTRTKDPKAVQRMFDEY